MDRVKKKRTAEAKKVDPAQESRDLYEVTAELRALAYLFERQGAHANSFVDDDMVEVGRGLASLLSSAAEKTRKSAQALDRIPLGSENLGLGQG